MKNLFTLIVLFASISMQAQIVNIPDANFKAALIADGVDTNNDGEIQVSEAEDENYGIDIESANISSLEGIQSFVNIKYLYAYLNNISTVDLSQNTRLEEINLSFNQLTSIDLSSCLELELIDLHGNLINEIDFSQNLSLIHIYIGENNLDAIDLSQNIYMESVQISSNNLVELDLSNNPWIYGLNMSYNPLLMINLKNGGFNDFNYPVLGLDNLQFVCVDDVELMDYNFIHSFPEGTPISSYCTFTPGGEYFTITGNSVLDIDSNGCDVTDPGFPRLQLHITDGNDFGNSYSDEYGNYIMYAQNGTHNITPILENPEYYIVEPTSIEVNFPEDGETINQNFCLTPNGVYNDLEVIFAPYGGAVPGFDSEYGLTYKNNGNTILSGSLTLNFDNDYMNLVSTDPATSTQDVGTLTWDFIDLAPFETRRIFLVMNLNTPTDSEFPLNSDDILTFEAEITSGLTDETPENNLFNFNQIVVNSYDPNDKTCLEGKTIDIEKVGEYLHYMIRFENTGTTNATNIVVKDALDVTRYDVSSLIPFDASHNFVTKVSNENLIEFIFENINLPFDDANNDGYVVYKVKTLPDLEIGDIIENDAEIYFDFNFPIITNNEQTTVIEEGLSINEFEGNSKVRIFPNPTSNILNIKALHKIESVKLFGLAGQEIKNINTAIDNSSATLNMNKLSTGFYFIEIQSGTTKSMHKVLKN